MSSEDGSPKVTRKEDYKLTVERRVKVKKSQIILRTLSLFKFKRGDEYVEPLHENNTADFWDGVIVYGWAGSLSGPGRQILQAGHWDLQYPPTHYEYFQIENIVDMEINTKRAWRGGSEHVLWLNTASYSYALQFPVPSYEDNWAAVIASWKTSTELDGTFSEIYPSSPRPAWFNDKDEWKFFEAKLGREDQSTNEESEEEPEEEPVPSTSKSRRHTSTSSSKAERPSRASTSSSKKPAPTSKSRVLRSSLTQGQTTTVRATPRRIKKKPRYVEVDTDEDENEDDGDDDEDDDDEDGGENANPVADESEGDEDAQMDLGGSESVSGGREESPQVVVSEQEDDSEIEVVEEQGRRGRNRQTRRIASRSAAKLGPSGRSQQGKTAGKGKGKEKETVKKTGRKKRRARSPSIMYEGKGQASTDPRKEAEQKFGSDNSNTGSDDDTPNSKRASTHRASSNHPESEALAFDPSTTEASGAGEKRKAVGEAPVGEEYSRAEKKRTRFAEVGESTRDESPQLMPTGEDTETLGESQASAGNLSLRMDSPTATQTSGSPMAIDETSSDVALQSPQQVPSELPTTPNRPLFGSSPNRDAWRPYTQAFPSTSTQGDVSSTQDSAASGAMVAPSDSSQSRSVSPSLPDDFQLSQGSAMSQAAVAGSTSLPLRSPAALAAGNAAMLRMAALQTASSSSSANRDAGTSPIANKAADPGPELANLDALNLRPTLHPHLPAPRARSSSVPLATASSISVSPGADRLLEAAAPSSLPPSAPTVTSASEELQNDAGSSPTAEVDSSTPSALPAAQESTSSDAGAVASVAEALSTANTLLTDEERLRRLTETDDLDERSPRRPRHKE